MNEEQYIALCAACDRVLLSSDVTDERVAVSWLHVIREHPLLLKAYADLFEPSSSFHQKIVSAIRDLVWRFYCLTRALFASGRFWFGNKISSEKIDFLFVSHLVNVSHFDQVEDFYFGRLPDDLAKNGYSVVIAFINHTSQQSPMVFQKLGEHRVPRVILARSLGFFEELSIQRRLSFESRRLKKWAKAEKEGFFRGVLSKASQEAVKGASQTSLRIGKQIGALSMKLHPKVLITTHEGHAWERLAFSAARKAFPDVRCMGYNHSAIFRMQHAIRRNIAPVYNPDVILAAGEVSGEKLRGNPGLKGVLILVLGSNRSMPGVFYSSNPAAKTNKYYGDKRGITCLLLPEGAPSDCHTLFRFSVQCARLCPDVFFVWRLHPLLTFDELKETGNYLDNLPENVQLSTATLEVDIASSDWALYKGSTAILPAVLAGVLPVYLAELGEMTNDPLYELGEERLSVSSAEEFAHAVEMRKNTPDSQRNKLFDKRQRYCKDFFTPLNSSVLENLVPRGCDERMRIE